MAPPDEHVPIYKLLETDLHSYQEIIVTTRLRRSSPSSAPVPIPASQRFRIADQHNHVHRYMVKLSYQAFSLVCPIAFYAYTKTVLRDRQRQKQDWDRDLEISLIQFLRCTSARTRLGTSASTTRLGQDYSKSHGLQHFRSCFISLLDGCRIPSSMVLWLDKLAAVSQSTKKPSPSWVSLFCSPAIQMLYPPRALAV